MAKTQQQKQKEDNKPSKGSDKIYLGEVMFSKGIKVPYDKTEEIDIKPRQRTDEVEVNWK